jgi:hypothetical protein
MQIPSVSKGDKETCIGDAFHFREKPLQVERSLGPSIAPARRKNGCFDDFRARSSSSRTIRPRETPALRAVWSSHFARSSGSRTVSVLPICLNCNVPCHSDLKHQAVLRLSNCSTMNPKRRFMKATVQARLDDSSRRDLERLARRLGWSPSMVVREALRRMATSYPLDGRPRIAGLGKFSSGIPDLGSNKKHLKGFGG